MKRKVILVDDEQKAREVLRSMLEKHHPEVEIVGEAQNVPEAVRLIHIHHPDVVFLDIEMPMYSGLELLDFLNKEEIYFKIIFVTAYSEHALEAFRLSALDYLLKPLQVEQLKEAMDKLHEIPGREQLSLLKSNYPPAEEKKIALSLSDGLTIIPLHQIIFIKAEGAYVQLHLVDGRRIVASKVLGDFIFLCDQHDFYRTHRSYMVNTEHIRRITRSGNEVVMSDETEIPITPERKSELIERFKAIKV